MKMRLLLVEDHQIVRQGVRVMLEAEPDFEIVGEASDGTAALGLIEKLHPDVVVLDLMMPGIGGLEVARSISQRFTGMRVVILSMHSDVAYVSESLRAGVSAYVLKDESSAELIRAIRLGRPERPCISPTISEESLAAYARRLADGNADSLQLLTLREKEIMVLTAQGLSSAEIARQLFISPRTVETHRTNLMKKIGVRNQKEMVRFAVQRGLIGEPH